MGKHFNTKKTALISGALLLFAAFQPLLAEPTRAEADAAVNAFLQKIASNLNKNAPMRIDRALILKNASVDNKTLIYNYILDVDELQKLSVEFSGATMSKQEIERGLTGIALKEDCSDPDDPFFRVGAKIGRYYFDHQKNLLFKVITEKADCSAI